jgi:nucleoside-diphosphate-sugar epimerase
MLNVLVLGTSGCLANILYDYFSKHKDDFNIYMAGRNKPFNLKNEKQLIYYDMFDEKTYNNLKKIKKIDVIINTIGTAGKLSYDTTKIAQMNYLITYNLIDLAKFYDCKIVHVSSYKVGDTTRNTPIKTDEIWRGPRSPYAWAKLAAENNLLHSNIQNVVLIRIGLISSNYAAKFYAPRVSFDGYVNVTQEKDFIKSIKKSLNVQTKGKEIIGSKIKKEKCLDYHKSMYGDRFEIVLPTVFFKIITSYLPHKMLDYADPDEHTYEYGFPGPI